MPVDYDKMLKRVGKLNGYDAYDVLGSGRHFDSWCDTKGYGNVDPQGKKRSHSNVWFQEYSADPNGLAARPPLLCFSDLLMEAFDLFGGEYGSETFTIEIDELKIGAPDWQQRILEDLRKLYGDVFECYVKW